MSTKLTIGDLRAHLQTTGLSPEKFAASVHVSNMTIRRWLQRRDSETIPEKYQLLLAPELAPSAVQAAEQFSASQTLGGIGGMDKISVGQMMDEIERSGKGFRDVATLSRDLKAKLKGARLDKVFADYCQRLMSAIRSPKTPLKAKAIAVGALLYFISPIDLIPDHIPVIGYLDDLAVLSLAVNSLMEMGLEPAAKKDSPAAET